MLLPDDRAAPLRADSSVEREIDAEIADHLAAAAAQLAREGLPADEAQRQAVERFGNVQTVRNRLWWIQQGEVVMLRAAAIALAIVLTLGLVAVGYGGWRLQHSLDDRMNQLALQLDAINQTQRKLLDQQLAPPTPSITGRVYLADPAQPAVGATVQICRVGGEVKLTSGQERKLPDVVRNLRADAQGRFDSGPLADGDYFVFAPLLPTDPSIATLREHFTQSEPIYLFAGRTPPPIELDLRLQLGRLRFELSQELPSQFDLPSPKGGQPGEQPKPENHLLIVGLRLMAHATTNPLLPWSPIESQPARWPMRGTRNYYQPPLLALPRNLPMSVDLPVGTYRVSAVAGVDQPSQGPQYRGGGDASLADDILSRGDLNLGFGPRRRMVDAPGADPADATIQIHEGQETVVVVQVPEGFEESIREASPTWRQGAIRPEALQSQYWQVKAASK